MRYWFISELFYPEEVSTGYVMTKIAEKINESTAVGVICGPANYQSKVFNAKYNLSDSILIKRVWAPELNKNKLYLRVLRFIYLTVGISLKIIFNVRKSDKVILVTNPPTLLPFVGILKKIIRFKLIIIVHDVFPENASVGGLIKNKSIIYKILTYAFKYSYKTANKLILVGSDMEDLFKKKLGESIPMRVITNWADHTDVYPFDYSNFYKNYHKNSDNKIIIQFAGNIGRVQGLDLLIRELSQINNKNIYFVIIGDGAQKNILLDIVNKENLDNVQFIDSQARQSQNEFLNACDIGIITLIPGMYGLGVPSKVYNILSAGKPIIFIGDKQAEISRYITNHDIGWAFSWNEINLVRDFFNGLGERSRSEILEKGKNARNLVENRFTKDIILNKYMEEILNVL